MPADGQLDQIHAFVAVAEQQNIESAAKKLHAAPDVINERLAMLEIRMGLELFDRSQSRLLLTGEGRELLTGSREVLAALARINDDARRIVQGQASATRVTVDEICPHTQIASVLQALRTEFPESRTRIRVTAPGRGLDDLVSEKTNFGIVATRGAPPTGFTGQRLSSIAYSLVAAANHPLARVSRPAERSEIERHSHIVTLDSTELSVELFGIAPRSTWRLERIETKRSIIIDGNGWGGMPYHLVSDDIASGRLVEFDIRGIAATNLRVAVCAVHRVIKQIAPEERWLIDRFTSASEC